MSLTMITITFKKQDSISYPLREIIFSNNAIICWPVLGYPDDTLPLRFFQDLVPL